MSSPTDQLHVKRIELVLQQLEQLPTLPTVALRVLDAVDDDKTNTDEVVALIASDLSLATRILQLVHSAGAGVRGEVSSVERAVVLLGFDAVRNAILAVTICQIFSGSKRDGSTFSREEFWKHSLAVGYAAELLAESMSGSGSGGASREPSPAPSQAFVCGLLHDLGKIALDSILPKSFARVVETVDLLRGNVADLERSIIGLDHTVVGKRLAERWNLPAAIREAVWLHGQHPDALPATVRNPRLVNLISLADTLAREQHQGYSGNYTFSVPRDRLIEAARISPAAVQAVTLKLVERIQARAHILDLGRASTPELYQQALTRANQELGRISVQLATKNRKLATRARYYDAFTTFQGDLRPDSPPLAVLHAIGRAAVEVLGISSVGVFSLTPGQPFAETVLLGDSGKESHTTIVDCPAPPEVRGNGKDPVLAAGDDLDWLMSDISPRLSGDRRFWICLEAGGICVGGVAWGAAIGEDQRLRPQTEELATLAAGWGLALRTAQIREEARTLAEQLADANKRIQDNQAELLRSRSLSGIGEMAAGAAHEMNNPLAVISGRSQLLASQLQDPSQKSAARLIHEQSDRLSEIITELMEFARPQAPRPQIADLGQLIDIALGDAKKENDPADRTIEVTMADDVPPVFVDANQIAAAIREVLDNAIHATDASRGQVQIHAAFDPHSSRLAMTISDNGRGMDEPTLKRACDPFFSSQPAGRRRGMGLAKALRWVESNGGSMQLESRPSEGTRVLILLPSAQPALAEASSSQRKVVT